MEKDDKTSLKTDLDDKTGEDSSVENSQIVDSEKLEKNSNKDNDKQEKTNQKRNNQDKKKQNKKEQNKKEQDEYFKKIKSAYHGVYPLPSSNTKIYLKKNLKEKLDFLHNFIKKEKEKETYYEHAFFLFGYETKDGNIVLNDLEIDKVVFLKNKIKGKQYGSRFTSHYLKKIRGYFKAKKYLKPVVVFGHTHPCIHPHKHYSADRDQTIYSNEFSEVDLRTFYNFTKGFEEYARHNNLNLRTAFGLINPEGDFNVVGWDLSKEESATLYKIPNVYMQDEDNPKKYNRLPSYSTDKYPTLKDHKRQKDLEKEFEA